MKIIILLLLVCSSKMYSQTILHGSVANLEGIPVMGASVLLYTDSLLTPPMVNYTTSQKNGTFSIELGKSASYWLQVKCLGYSDCVSKVCKRSKVQSITLCPSTHTLSEVIIKGSYSGIKVSGDTIKFDASHFRNGFENSVGDLLNNMPGVSVRDDGSVSYAGKVVSNLLVNGKDLFSKENSGLVVKNMSADVVTGAEFIQNYQNNDLNGRYSQSSRLALNIRTKDLGDITGYFNAQGGYENKYDIKSFTMAMHDRFSLTTLLSANNTGIPAFTPKEYISRMLVDDDLMSGGRQTFNISGSEAALLYRPDNMFKDNGKLGAFDGKLNLSDKLTVSGNLLFNKSDAEGETTREETYLSNSLLNTSQLDNRVKGDYFLANMRLDWKPTDKMQLISFARFSATDANNNLNAHNNSYSINYLQLNHQKEFGVSGGASANLAVDNGLINLEVNTKYSNAKNYYDLTTDADTLPTNYEFSQGLYHINNEINRNSLHLTSQVGYIHHFSEIYQLSVSASYLFHRQTTHLYSKVDERKNDERLNINETAVNFLFKKSIGTFRFSVGSSFVLEDNYLTSVFNNKQLEIRPTVDLEYVFSPTRDLSLTFSRGSDEIEQDKMSSLKMVDAYNEMVLGTSVRSPYVANNKLQFAYFDYQIERQMYLTAFANFQISRNSITPNIHQEGLINLVSYSNDGHAENAYSIINIEKRFLSFPLGVKGTGSCNYIKSPSVLNGVQDNQKLISVLAKIVFTSYFHSQFNGELSLKNIHDWNCAQSNDIRTELNEFEIQGKMMFQKSNWKLQTVAGYSMVKSHHSDCTVYDIGFTSEYKLGNITLKLIAKNLLNLNNAEWIRTFTTDYYSSTERYHKIPGYIMLSVKWNY